MRCRHEQEGQFWRAAPETQPDPNSWVKDRLGAEKEPEAPQVEDQFVEYLNSIGYDKTGCFALTAVGAIVDGSFVPDISMWKLAGYGIPNTMHDIYLMTPDSTDHARAGLRQPHDPADAPGPQRRPAYQL